MPRSSLHFERQSRVLEDGVTRVSPLLEGPKPCAVPSDLPQVQTLFDALKRGLEASSNGPCLGSRVGLASGRSRWAWASYADVTHKAQQIGSALLSWGLAPGEESRVGTMGLTTADHLTVNLACAGFSLVVVPLYHNYQEDAQVHIVKSCALSAIFVDTAERVEVLLRNIHTTPSIKRIVQLNGKVDKDLKKKHPSLEFLELEDVIQIGHNNMRPFVAPLADSLFMVCHTSGTTGPPKGVMITHKALVAAASGCRELFLRFGMAAGPGDTYFSYLPLAHVFEHLNTTHMLMSGSRIGFYRGEITQLIEDMQELRPTIVALVPRLLNRLHDRIMAGVATSGGLRRRLFHKALNVKLALLNTGVLSKEWRLEGTLWDKLVLRKVSGLLGGNVRHVWAGGAPVDAAVLRFFRAVLGAVVTEGYGQTECCGAATITLPDELLGGSVGGPSTCVEVRLGPAVELGYAGGTRGEVLIRGPSLMRGYFGNPEATADALDKDGWLHTGDIGEWTDREGLRLIDRAKAFFKLAQGEYVSPERAEVAYAASTLVQQIFVTGIPLAAHLVAVVVPEMEAIRGANLGLSPEELCGSDAELRVSAAVRRGLLAHLRSLGAEKGLSSLEQVKALHLTEELFGVDNGLLTPILKLRRQQLKSRYKDQIESLYK